MSDEERSDLLAYVVILSIFALVAAVIFFGCTAATPTGASYTTDNQFQCYQITKDEACLGSH